MELLAPALSITLSHFLFVAEAEVKSLYVMGRCSTFIMKNGKIHLQDCCVYDSLPCILIKACLTKKENCSYVSTKLPTIPPCNCNVHNIFLHFYYEESCSFNGALEIFWEGLTYTPQIKIYKP